MGLLRRSVNSDEVGDNMKKKLPFESFDDWLESLGLVIAQQGGCLPGT